MPKPEYKILTGKDRPDLLKATNNTVNKSWPEFMLHDPYVGEYWDALFLAYPEFHFGLQANSTGEFIALGNSVPLAWDGKPYDLPDKGIDWVLEQGFDDHSKGRPLKTLCALQIVIDEAYRGKGLSSRMVRCMMATGMANSLDRLIAPVRPPSKSNYPLAPMDRFIRWKDNNGFPLDPWMRVHARLGAQTIKPCAESMLITGTVDEWEKWAKMHFPESGSYIVPGALSPVEIDRQADTGTYIEPNVWMMHYLR
ncbi:MAG: GNAT family N-acetyltransferase [candidate division Zixibacteria bacterium]|nr:GNAT family N-acetyltransferase [candidate division Zixibacteria bacterium]MBU1469126.1 GNAT family N-acetyltransferase [candidate division Zixibacteria bacterium]MBU2624873.1 GNAT family N-acetyltransferase [candidate division Zixibacteria bacterium]